MAIEKVNDLLKKLGMKDGVTVKDTIWQPWIADKDHKDDPQGFVGIYRGYKVASKMVPPRDGRGKDRLSVFDLFAFDECNPAPAEGTTWLVASSFKLEELKRIRPGTKIAIVFAGSEKNQHGGQTPDVQFYCEDDDALKKALLPAPMPPTNATRYLTGREPGADDTDFPPTE